MAHYSVMMTAAQMVESWVVMKVQTMADDSEMMTARSSDQKTVLQMVHHLVVVKVVNWVQMKVDA